MYIAQQCFELSDEGIEDAIYEAKPSAAWLALISQRSHTRRHCAAAIQAVAEKHLTAAFDAINKYLAEEERMMRTGAEAGATSITAPSSTKNKDMRGRIPPKVLCCTQHQPEEGHLFSAFLKHCSVGLSLATHAGKMHQHLADALYRTA